MNGRSALFASVATLALLPTAVSAQILGNYPPPAVGSLVDERRIDLFAGRPVLNDVQVAIGDPASSGLARIYYANGLWDNFTGGINADGSSRIVSIGRSSERFSLVGGIWTSDQKSGSTLTQSGVVYTYTAADGTIARFSTGRAGNVPTAANVARLYEITYPSGEVISITFKTLSVSEAPSDPPVRGERVQSVSSSLGYQLKYLYAGNTWNTWFTLTKIIALNTSVESCSTSADSCSPTGSWPTVTFSAQASNNVGVFTETDALGRSTSRTTSGVSYPGGLNITYGRDAYNRVTSWSNGTQTWNYGYATNGDEQTTTVTDPAGKSRLYRFSISLQALKSITNELGRTVTNDLEPGSGRVLATIQPEGNKVSFGYDARGNVTTTTATSKTGGATITSTTSFPASCTNALTCNKPVSTTDARGAVTDYTYDPTHGGLLTVTGPADSAGVRPQTRYSYTRLASNGTASATGIWTLTGTSVCAAGASCAGTAAETVTGITYTQGLLPSSIAVSAGNGAVSATTGFTYDSIGNLTRIDGPLAGNADTTVLQYDAIRRPTAIIGPDPDGGGSLLNRMRRITYDARGRVSLQEAGTSNAAGGGFTPLQQESLQYDAVDRLTRRTFGSGGTAYAVSQFGYDTVGRRVCDVMRMDPSQWAGQSNPCLPQTSGTHGPDRVVRTGYLDDGSVMSVTTADGTPEASTDAITYTPNGQQATVTDANGNVTTYAYDGFDRLLSTSFPGGSYEQLGYDANGNVTSRRLRDGQTIGYGYDALDRLTQKSPAGENAVTYGYDLLDHLTASSRVDVGTATLSYDALGRMTGDAQTFGSLGYQYDAAGRRTRVTWGDGFFVTYEYDLAGAMTAVRENGGTLLASFTYDNLGRRTSLTRGNGTSTSYGYDPASRLTSLGLDLAGSTQDLTVGFGYNPAAQISSRTSSNDAYAFTGAYNVDRSYGVNGLNQLTNAGGTALGYDGRGNLTTSGGSSYGYTLENRMRTASGGVSLYYDQLGRLQEYDTNVSTRFIHDGGQISAEIANPGGVILRRYVYGSEPDEALVWYEGAGTSDRRWLHADERGSVVAVTNGSGSATTINSYDEFGIPGSNNAGRFQYTGQAWLSGLGMYYYKARMYSLTLGRFMQTDPIGYADGLNWYNYVGSDPINATDPSGLQQQPAKPVSNACQVQPNGSDANCFPTPSIVVVGRRLPADASPPPPPSIPASLQIVGGGRTGGTEVGGGTGNNQPQGVEDKPIEEARLALPKALIKWLLRTKPTAKPVPKAVPQPKNWKPPIHGPQAPPTSIPQGWRVRSMGPNSNYPNGYWRLEKPMGNGGWQGINPSTGKPGPEWETHIPFP